MPVYFKKIFVELYLVISNNNKILFNINKIYIKHKKLTRRKTNIPYLNGRVTDLCELDICSYRISTDVKVLEHISQGQYFFGFSGPVKSTVSTFFNKNNKH